MLMLEMLDAGVPRRSASLQVLPDRPEHDQRGRRDPQGQGHGRHSRGKSLRGRTSFVETVENNYKI